MPKKNKPSKNGFWQFVMECRDKQPNKSMDEVKNQAALKWSGMNAEQKLRYQNMARLARDSYNPARITTDGLEIEELERQDKQNVEDKQLMKQTIEDNIRSACLANDLADKVFLIIHINHLTHIVTDNTYFICEIAISAFSLRNGVEEVFHRIVHPGKLPLGYAGPGRAHSKETHQLYDLVQDDPYPNNTYEVFEDMVKFMRKFRGKNKNLPILYCDDKTAKMTANVLENFCYIFEFDEPIKIYSLPHMFFALRNGAARKTVWPSDTFSYNELEKDIYSFTSDISCEFHEVSDCTLYCSKSIVTRCTFVICDACCDDLNIQMIAGKHVPLRSKIVQATSGIYDQAQSTTSQSVTSADSDSDGWSMKTGRNKKSKATPEKSSMPQYYAPSASSWDASSMVSFSSMKSQKPRTNAAERIEKSFRNVTIGETQSAENRNLHFPALGKSRKQN